MADKTVSAQVLVKTNYDYGDEFNTYGWCICTWHGYMDYRKEIRDYFEEEDTKGKALEVFFGTNEWIEFSSAEDVWNGITTFLLTAEEATFMEKALGSRSGGLVPYDRIVGAIEDI